MNPNCDIVENANTFFRSSAVSAIKPPASAVRVPIHAIKFGVNDGINSIGIFKLLGFISKNNEYILAPKNNPAFTIVELCNNADTGVGPSIASGNQPNSGS